MKCQWHPLEQRSGRRRPNMSLSYLKRVVAVLQQCWALSPLTVVLSSPFPSCPPPPRLAQLCCWVCTGAATAQILT